MSNAVRLPSTHGLSTVLRRRESPPFHRFFRGDKRLPVKLTSWKIPRVQTGHLTPQKYAKSVALQFQKRTIKEIQEAKLPIEEIKQEAQRLEEAELKARGMTRADENPDKIFMDSLNIYIYGSPTYKRFNKFISEFNKINSAEESSAKTLQFLIEEATNELKTPNKDVMTLSYMNEHKPKNEEEQIHMISKQLDKQFGLSLQRQSPYRISEALLRKLNSVLESEVGLMVVSVPQLKAIFDLALEIQDIDISEALKAISGRALFRLGKVDELTLDKQYYLIGALIDSQAHLEAQALLDSTNVERPMWYQLKALNAIGYGNFDAAENYIRLIKELFKVKYVQGDIYVTIIERYVFVSNFERAEYWRKEFEEMIEARGMRDAESRNPFFVAPPKEKCEYLDKFHQTKSVAYLMVVGWYIATEGLSDKVPDMIEFYLKQPNTKMKDLDEVLLSFRYELSSKIKPQMKKLKNKSAEKYLFSFIQKYKKEQPLAAQQEAVLNETLQELAELGGFRSITFIIENMIAQKQKPTAQHYDSLIQALLKRDKVDLAFKVLTALEGSYLSLEDTMMNPEQPSGEQLFPPVNSYHYAQFVKYFANKGNDDMLDEIFVRFTNVYNIYSSIFLSQLLKSYERHNRYLEAFTLIDEILIENLHIQGSYEADNSAIVLYMTIWKVIKNLSYSRNAELKQKIEIPDIRFVFMKMIHDKVVPSQRLYDTVIDVFLHEKDYYGAICVLQYMGKIHRTQPHKYTVSKIKKLCKFVKFNEKSHRILPRMDPAKRYDVNHNFNKYKETFDLIKSQTSYKNTFDPFATEEVEEEDSPGHIEEHDADVNDTVWKFLVHQLMTLVQAQEMYDKSVLIRVHDDFGLDYEADRIVKEQEDIKQLEKLRNLQAINK